MPYNLEQILKSAARISSGRTPFLTLFGTLRCTYLVFSWGRSILRFGCICHLLKNNWALIFSRFMTIRLVVTVPSMFVWKEHIISISKKMVQVLENINPANQPLFIHCFSNGGAYLYQYFVAAVKFSKKPMIVRKL